MSRANACAFPTVASDPGLTIREYYAGLAMQGFMANKDRPQFFSPKDDAAYCLAIADALIAELAKPADGEEG